MSKTIIIRTTHLLQLSKQRPGSKDSILSSSNTSSSHKSHSLSDSSGVFHRLDAITKNTRFAVHDNGGAP